MTVINATFNGKQKPTHNKKKEGEREKNTFSLQNANPRCLNQQRWIWCSMKGKHCILSYAFPLGSLKGTMLLQYKFDAKNRQVG